MKAPPPLLDERWAIWAAATVAQRHRSAPNDVFALRRRIDRELPKIDAAARTYTRLGADLAPATVAIVGRLGWVRSNLAALRGAFEPLRDRLGDRPAAAQLLGVQLGTIFGLMSSKVLGQFIVPLGPRSPREGQLVVVGPNVAALSIQQPEIADDLRRGVLLHELTHRLQFAAAPWLVDHLRQLLADYLLRARIEPDALRRTFADAPRLIAEIRDQGSIRPLIDQVLDDEQSALLDRAQGMMSLLEGHGNTVMFEASTAVVEDTQRLRDALANRRNDLTSRMLTSLFGLDAKRRQYRDGEVFVRHVIDEAGIDVLNRAFDNAHNLPDVEEIGTASEWLRRVGA